MDLRHHRNERLWRRYIDNAGAGFPEMGINRFHDVKSAQQINIQHRLEAIRGEIGRQSGKVAGGPGDHHVQFAKPIRNLCHPCRKRGGIADISRETGSFSAQGLQRPHRRRHFLLVTAGYGDPGALSGEQFRHSPIDSAGAADDQNCFAAEVEHRAPCFAKMNRPCSD